MLRAEDVWSRWMAPEPEWTLHDCCSSLAFSQRMHLYHCRSFPTFVTVMLRFERLKFLIPERT